MLLVLNSEGEKGEEKANDLEGGCRRRRRPLLAAARDYNFLPQGHKNASHQERDVLAGVVEYIVVVAHTVQLLREVVEKGFDVH